MDYAGGVLFLFGLDWAVSWGAGSGVRHMMWSKTKSRRGHQELTVHLPFLNSVDLVLLLDFPAPLVELSVFSSLPEFPLPCSFSLSLEFSLELLTLLSLLPLLLLLPSPCIFFFLPSPSTLAGRDTWRRPWREGSGAMPLSCWLLAVAARTWSAPRRGEEASGAWTLLASLLQLLSASACIVIVVLVYVLPRGVIGCTVCVDRSALQFCLLRTYSFHPLFVPSDFFVAALLVGISLSFLEALELKHENQKPRKTRTKGAVLQFRTTTCLWAAVQSRDATRTFGGNTLSTPTCGKFSCCNTWSYRSPKTGSAKCQQKAVV